MKLFQVLLVVAFLITGYSSESSPPDGQSDTDIAQKIVGTWKVDEKSANGITARGTETIKKDGTFASNGSLSQDDRHIDLNFTGQWHVDQGVLTETVTASNNTNLVGFVSHDKILKVDAQHLVYQSHTGTVVTRERLK